MMREAFESVDASSSVIARVRSSTPRASAREGEVGKDARARSRRRMRCERVKGGIGRGEHMGAVRSAGGVDGDDGERAVRLDDDDGGVGASVAGERAVVRVDDGVAVWEGEEAALPLMDPMGRLWRIRIRARARRQRLCV